MNYFSDERFEKLRGLVSLPMEAGVALAIVPIDNSSTPPVCAILVEHEGKFVELSKYFDAADNMAAKNQESIQPRRLIPIEIETGKSVPFILMGVARSLNGGVTFQGFLGRDEEKVVMVSDILENHRK